MPKYELHENRNEILSWHWYAVYDDYTPAFADLTDNEVVKRGGVYISGHKTKEHAIQHGIANGWMKL